MILLNLKFGILSYESMNDSHILARHLVILIQVVLQHVMTLWSYLITKGSYFHF